MPHRHWKEYCGKPCEDCEVACGLDESLPCAPNCELLGEDGVPLDIEKCFDAECDAYLPSLNRFNELADKLPY